MSNVMFFGNLDTLIEFRFMVQELARFKNFVHFLDDKDITKYIYYICILVQNIQGGLTLRQFFNIHSEIIKLQIK